MRPRHDDANRTIIQSEIFPTILYECKKNHVIVHGGVSGTMAVSFEVLDDLILELKAIQETYQYD